MERLIACTREGKPLTAEDKIQLDKFVAYVKAKKKRRSETQGQ